MSEQEKKSAGTAIGSSVVMMEKTTNSCHKQPYRPTELQDESTDFHHKRSKAPVVSSVAEDLKNIGKDTTINENAESEDQREYAHAISSEKQKHSVFKKLSSNTKKREPSPESITLATLEVEKKKLPLHSIPVDVQSDLIDAEKESSKKANEDSITEEIAELQTPEVAKKHSEWSTRSHVTKNKAISWNDRDRPNVLQELGARSEAWMLDRKASVGPCYRPGLPFEGPSGIMICLPKRSMRCVNQSSGISINISRKCSATKSKLTVNDPKRAILNSEKVKSNKAKCETTLTNCVSNIREKISNMQSKIKGVFHM